MKGFILNLKNYFPPPPSFPKENKNYKNKIVLIYIQKKNVVKKIY